MVLNDDIANLVRIAMIPFVAVLVSMVTDLVSGLYKAKVRNEATTSFGLHRTVIKFISYEGSLLVALCIDVMVHYTHIWEIIGVRLLYAVPVLTIVLGAFNCFVELVSIREKASKKADKRAVNQLIAIVRTLGSDDVKKMLTALGKIKEEEEADEVL